MPSPFRWIKKWLRHHTVQVILFGLIYFVSIPLGNTFLVTQGNSTTFWPAAGLVLATLLLARLRVWPFFLLAAILAEAAANLILFGPAIGYSRAAFAGAILGFVNGLEALTGAYLIRYFFKIPVNLTQLQSILAIALWGAVVGATVGATVGSTFLTVVYPDTSYWSFWQGWWLSNILGILIFTPAILSLADIFNDKHSPRLSQSTLIEFTILLLSVIIVVALGFRIEPTVLTPAILFPYLLLPFLLWAALRFSPHVVSLLLVITSFSLTINALQGRGPFILASQTNEVNLISLQIFLIFNILSALILAAVVCTLKMTRGKLAEERNLLRTVIDNIPDMIYAKDQEGHFLVINAPVLHNFNQTSYENVIGKTEFDFPRRTPIDKAKKFLAEEQQVITSGEALIHKDIHDVDPNGFQRWFNTSRAPLKDQHEQIIGTVGITRDITERKEAEQALQEYAERLRTLHDIDQAILAARSPREIAEVALHHVRQLIPCQRAELLFFDPSNYQAIRLAVDTDETTTLDADTRLPLHPFQDLVEEIRSKRYIIVDYSKAVDDRFKRIQEEGIQTGVFVPLVTQDTLVGALGLGATSADFFSFEQEAIAQEISAQLAITLQQAHLRETQIKRRQEAEALRDIATVLNSTLDLGEVLDHILDNVGRVVPHDAANIMFESDGVARIIRQRGYDVRGLEETTLQLRFVIEDTPNLRKMVKTLQPLAIPDTRTDPTWLVKWVQSYASAPIRRAGRVIGFLNLDSGTPNAFSMADAERLQVFADQAAVALDNAQLHEQIQTYAEELEQRVSDRTRELSALYEISAVASESLDLQVILTHTLEKVLDAMQSQSGGIYLMDEETSALHLKVEKDTSMKALPQVQILQVGQGLSGWIIKNDTPLMVPDIATDPRTYPPNGARSQIYAGAPMHASSQAIGVLCVLREPHQLIFSAEEIALLSSIADQVGVVVERARLREQAEQAAVMEERRRLARDLHDSVTQLLYSINLFAGTGQEACQQGNLEIVQDNLAELSATAKQALKEMRLLVYELRPPVLEHDGLVGALQHRLDAVEGRAAIQTKLRVNGEVALPPEIEDALYHIAQEALNNSLKHASATLVTIELNVSEKTIQMIIMDNGMGFDPAEEYGQGGLGLVSMQERVEQLMGHLMIKASSTQGTTVQVSIDQRGSN